MKNLFLLFTHLLLFTNLSFSQTTINVPGDYPTIQEGINASLDGDIVLVADGTYYENINFNGKAITVASHFLMDGDREHIDNTIINAPPQVVTFDSGEDTTSVLCGFTIKGGTSMMHPDTKPLVGTDMGGGIYCENSGPKIVFNSITNHYIGSGEHGSLGAGIFSICGSISSEYYIVIENNIISNNFAYGHESAGIGGGIYFYKVKGRICNNLIIQNSCSGRGASGGGMGFLFCRVQIINNTILNNISGVNANHSTGCGGIFSFSSELIILNNIIWGNIGDKQISENAGVFYCDIEGGYPGLGNIEDYPEFVDTANGDYNLVDESPCIGSGIDSLEIAGVYYYSPFIDLEGNPRPNPTGSLPDMGAYESPLANPVGVEDDLLQIPNEYSLAQNFPNPFNPSTKIRYAVSQLSDVTIKVFDVLGNEIETLVNEEKPAGSYEITWYADYLPTGIYFYRLKAGSFVESKKMVLIK